MLSPTFNLLFFVARVRLKSPPEIIAAIHQEIQESEALKLKELKRRLLAGAADPQAYREQLQLFLNYLQHPNPLGVQSKALAPPLRDLLKQHAWGRE